MKEKNMNISEINDSSDTSLDEGVKVKKRKHLHFGVPTDNNMLQFVGCTGSLGEPRKLVFTGYGISRSYARFMLYTDNGAYGVSTEGYEPGFQTMRFLSVWREDKPSLDEYRALLFEPRLIASIEKAGLSFENNIRINEYKSGDEITILDHYAALEHLRSCRDFHIDFWPLETGTLARILWCDNDGRPLCGRIEDSGKVAENDYGVWSVFAASHPSKHDSETFTAYYQRRFFAQRYAVYARCRHGVKTSWSLWP